MIRQAFILGIAITYIISGFAQGVSINNDGSAPAAGAVLDIKSTSSGLLIPRMTEVQRDAITPDTHSMLIYQTDNDSGFYYYYEPTSSWLSFLTGGKGANAGWKLNGNSGTNPGNHFIGTTDSIDWVIRTNNNEKMRVTGNGNVGIGTSGPTRKLHVVDNSSSVLSEFTSSNVFGAGIHLNNTGAGGTKWTIYSSGASNNGGAGNLHINEASGSGNIILTPNNNIGVGDTEPDATLEIVESGNTPFMISNGAGGDGDFFFVKNDGNIGIGSTSPSFKFDVFGDARFNIGTTGTFNDFRVNDTTGSIGLYVRENGNVGIKTLSPSAPFHVPDGPNGDASVRFANGFGTSKVLHIIEEQGSSEHYGIFVGAANYSSAAFVTKSGNIGIGTTLPTSKLVVTENNESTTLTDFTQAINKSGIQISTEFTSGAYTPGIFWQTSNDNPTKPKAGIWLFENGGGTKMHFGTSNSYGVGITNNGLTLDRNGNVGIGTTSPGSIFHISSTGTPYVRVTNTTNNIEASLQSDAISVVSGSITNHPYRFITNNVEKVRILANGNVGIGTTTPSHLLHVTGIARSTQATWATTSDKRVKTNIKDLKEGLDVVMKMRPVEYEYTKKYQKFNQGYDGLKRGFIAQEIKEILPEMITIMEEKVGNDVITDFHLLNNNDFTPILIKAVQEQQQVIENQETEIEALKAENAKKVDQSEIDQLKSEYDQRLKKLETLLEMKAKK